jgi:hypothetical protein
VGNRVWICSTLVLFGIAPESQIKARNVVMQVTDNPVGSVYRSPVMDVASAQPRFTILCVLHSIIIPPVFTEELVHA